MTEQEDISSCYFTIEDFDTFVGGCLQEPKPILRYALDKCLNVWIKEDWENLELYHMKNNATENNY